MKYKVFFIVFVLTLISCDTGDYTIQTFPRARVINIEAPDELIFNQDNAFQVTFEVPTDCDSFEKFQVTGQGSNLTVETILRFQGGDQFCNETPDNTQTETFELFVDSQEDYTIRFLIAINESQFIYETLNIPVAD